MKQTNNNKLAAQINIIGNINDESILLIGFKNSLESKYYHWKINSILSIILQSMPSQISLQLEGIGKPEIITLDKLSSTHQIQMGLGNDSIKVEILIGPQRVLQHYKELSRIIVDNRTSKEDKKQKVCRLVFAQWQRIDKYQNNELQLLDEAINEIQKYRIKIQQLERINNQLNIKINIIQNKYGIQKQNQNHKQSQNNVSISNIQENKTYHNLSSTQFDVILEDQNQDQNQYNIQQILQLNIRSKVQLENKVASLTHQIAQIFNAAYQFGGHLLLNTLQNSIGLLQAS